MSSAGGQPTLPLDDEDLHLPGAGQLEGEGLTGGRWHAMPRRPGIELEEEGAPCHLRVAG